MSASTNQYNNQPYYMFQTNNGSGSLATTQQTNKMPAAQADSHAYINMSASDLSKSNSKTPIVNKNF